MKTYTKAELRKEFEKNFTTLGQYLSKVKSTPQWLDDRWAGWLECAEFLGLLEDSK